MRENTKSRSGHVAAPAFFCAGTSGQERLAHDVFDTHEYLDSLKSIKDATFNEYFEEFRAKCTL